MSESGGIEEKLAHLKQSYVEQLPIRLLEIEKAADFNHEMKTGKLRASLKSAMALTHKLAGSGATFGFPAVSEAARAVENFCSSTLSDDNRRPEQIMASMERVINGLKRAIAAAVSGPSVGTNEQDSEENYQAGQSREDANDRTVVLIGCDDVQAERLISELNSFGLQAKYFETSGNFHNFELDPVPTGIVFDLDRCNDKDIVDGTSLSIVRSVLDDRGIVCPLIVVSENGDVPSRLQASRAKASSFLVKPYLTASLVDSLEVGSIANADENYRILIVDDDESTAAYTKAVLNGAGMIAETENDPMNILLQLRDFSPELILMDLYMTGCNGQELASVIRQQEVFAGIPIVYLSGEDDVEIQLGAMQYGGDDFLTKPIRSSHLISAIKMRSRRFRELRGRMIRDSMTGLLNHTTTQEFLKNEINRARREKVPLALASLDIDHFKIVNDTYGHAVGDVVIKSLARLLKQRLRSNDIVGRMGGEEFAAVLVGASFGKAREILDEIRVSFANILQVSGGKEFSVTLSCGIAEYPDFGTQAELMDAADKALYEAKHGGRNRVVMAAP